MEKTFSSVSKMLQKFDDESSVCIYKAGQKIPRMILQALELSGDGLLWIPITGALCWAPYFSLQSFFRSLFIGFIFDLAFIGSIKAIVRRPRPVYNKGMYLVVSVDHYSFPSGHSSRAFLIFTFVHEYASLWKKIVFQLPHLLGLSFFSPGSFDLLAYYVLGFAVFLWTIATASSRVLLGRHYLLDVVSGSLFGVLEALFVIKVILQLEMFNGRWLYQYGPFIKDVFMKFLG